MLSQRTPSLRNTAATSHLSTLSHSDISAWTDGSVPGGLGQGGAGINIKCTKCVTATSLSFSTGLWATSYSAETFALLHALEWCISHSKTCNFISNRNIYIVSVNYIFIARQGPVSPYGAHQVQAKMQITIQIRQQRRIIANNNELSNLLLFAIIRLC